MDPRDFARVVADRQRLAALGALALRPRTVGELARILEIERRAAVRVLGKLAASGLVRVSGDIYHLDEDLLRRFARDLTQREPADREMFRNLSEIEASVAAEVFAGAGCSRSRALTAGVSPCSGAWCRSSNPASGTRRHR